MESRPFIVAFSADSDQEKNKDADPDRVFEKIVNEKPDRYVFGGDGPYSGELHFKDYSIVQTVK